LRFLLSTVCAQESGHREGDQVVIDALYEKAPPFSPEAAIAELCTVLNRYRIHKVVGDRFGGQFPAEQFLKRSIAYETSPKSKTDIYVDFLPILNSGAVTLPKNDRLVHQLCSLERTVTKGSGKDVIDHPRGMHDDLANVAAGAATVVHTRYGSYPDDNGAWIDNRPAADVARSFLNARMAAHVRRFAGGPRW
jgi:hypothetical protein